jgi:PAS domain-containing protein
MKIYKEIILIKHCGEPPQKVPEIDTKGPNEMPVQAGALQSAIFNSANFSSIATDAKGVIQIFNVGAERMLGYTAAEVMNKITPADIHGCRGDGQDHAG